ncbi:MAG: two-component sensor histidine kinase [Desulfobacteraceae bacterium]|nr:MAG: two-component sensor histidine kinase [Desulfobacteraceae bacterium]
MKLFNHIIARFKPTFWNIETSTSSYQILFNYRKFWLFSIFLRVTISVVPLVIFLIINFSLARTALRNENKLRTVRITSNAKRTISYFLEERLNAMKFVLKETEFERIKTAVGLSSILQNLKMGFGGFADLGLIDESGMQINYAGPFDLVGKNYREQEWFMKCVNTGSYISDVFLGYRKLPHMIIALKWPMQNGSFYVLRSTLDIKNFIQILSSLELSRKSDVFLCNREGLLQTPSKYYGKILKRIDLPIPEYSPHSEVIEIMDKTGIPILIGYAYIENSPYILMLVKQSKEIMIGWYSLRNEMIWFFAGCTIVTIIAALSTSTFMVNKIYNADQTRLQAMERLESSSRLISIGRLAAGIAHEINNPLAVINENAGLIKDLFTLKKEYKADQRLMELIDDVLESVERCGGITKQLLGFARHFEPTIQPLQLNRVISEVLSFFGKEASYRNISINVDIPEDFPIIYSDHGSLQQIFFNLINNSFQAMNEGGRLDVLAAKKDERYIALSIKDDGCGISQEDQKTIFEPFFTMKTVKGGTGLGLSIVHGLVRKLKGNISVSSKIGEGATFTVTLPIKHEGDI